MKPKRLEWTLNISKTRLAGNTFAGDAQKSPSCTFFQSLQTTRGFFSPVLKGQNFLPAERFNDVSTATFSLGFLLKQFLPGFHHLTHFGGGFSLILGWTNDTNKTQAWLASLPWTNILFWLITFKTFKTSSSPTPPTPKNQTAPTKVPENSSCSSSFPKLWSRFSKASFVPDSSVMSLCGSKGPNLRERQRWNRWQIRLHHRL